MAASVKCPVCEQERKPVEPPLNDEARFWIKQFKIVMTALVLIVLIVTSGIVLFQVAFAHQIETMLKDPSVKIHYEQGTNLNSGVLRLER